MRKSSQTMTDPNTSERIPAEEPEMNASSPQQFAAEPYDDYDDGFDDDMPVRPRASYLTPLTALLMALILGGVGFYVGIRVEKSQDSSGTGGSSLARAFSGASGFAGAAGGTSKTGATSRTGATGTAGAGSFASRFAAGGFGGAAGGTVGSVSSVSGNTLYVKETNGNTVKVKLTGATKLSKSETVSRKKVYPGDEVVVAGNASSNGTVNATSVTDSGASSTSSSGSSGTGSSSTSSSSSAIGSLFGGG